ncbi:tetratricopeptide repeat protein [Aurantimonas sp. VKM B-3413]|uniref:tetratricopeptide repeat-containing glycosyltransferase family protein n=1 Tax=Aurantimonas sp. VKM B-3413 TaxID=2779401 RepID=UPI001E362B1D|nr:tetratricopeptide repeat-containing glycosyltransferase family protein [Aurantimonas sp. VKM B-3413]MCB8838612.1 tetratricopeptide repeat-containing glycosyltransferase family protein [Aurantimonas sp. VKM B-3413]
MNTKLALKPAPKKSRSQDVLQKIQLLQKDGNYKESRPLCDILSAQGEKSPDFLHRHGLALRACGDLMGALVKINAAVEQRPNDAKMVNSLGVVLLDLKEVEAAIEFFKRTTALDKKFFDGWNNLGLALKRAERYQAAELAFRGAYEIDSSRPDPIVNLVGIMMDLRQYKRAEIFLDQMMSAMPKVPELIQVKRLFVAARLEDFDYIAAHHEAVDRTKLSLNEQANLDNIVAYYLNALGRDDEAVSILEKWAEINTPHQEQMITFLGLCYGEAGRFEEGIAFHNRLLAKNPDHIAGRYNLSFLQFKTGVVAEGYDNYEARWRWTEFPTKRRLFDAPRWEGEDLADKKLLVWREQGIGDEVRFASLLPELKDKGAALTFECSPKLAPVWAHSFPWATVRHEGELDCRGEPAYAEFDYQIPIGSLGKIFRRTVADFHSRQVPWIRRYPETEAKVREQLAVQPGKMLVGLCWRSSNQVTTRNKYYLSIEQLALLKALPNCEFLNVQYDGDPAENERIRALGLPIHHFANLDQKNDLVGASCLIGACDIVISAGVSVADIAAGLGVPVIQVSKKSSEIFLGTDHVPWYPTCMSVRMPPNGGAEAIAGVVARWPSIVEWAKGVTASGRDTGDWLRAAEGGPAASGGFQSGLDFQYDFDVYHSQRNPGLSLPAAAAAEA